MPARRALDDRSGMGRLRRGPLSTTLVLALLYRTAHVHRKRLTTVPVRIHVAGSRGKTSTARLIGAGLRTGGRRVLVKTTGTVPRIMLPDGQSEPWPRSGPPSISELVRFFRVAEDWQAEVAVVESMGIEPEYLWASEHYLIGATHLIVTNLRPDHEEVLETTRAAMSEAVALLVPSAGRVFLAPESAAEPVLHACSSLDCAVNVVSTADLPPLEVNPRLALAVCAELGVPPKTASRGMASCQPDPGRRRDRLFLRQCLCLQRNRLLSRALGAASARCAGGSAVERAGGRTDRSGQSRSSRP